MKKEYDVIVIGTGAAGLYGALQFDPSVSVLLISKRELTLSNSSLAQDVYKRQSIFRMDE